MSKPKIYVDANAMTCLIKSKVKSNGFESEYADDVWYVDQILEAARAKEKEVEIFTSSISIAECTHVNDPAKEQIAQVHFRGLLESGKAGIMLINPITPILFYARDLRWNSAVKLSGADSIHVASALKFGCDELWTRDDKMTKNASNLAKLGIRICAPCETHLMPQRRRQLMFPV